MSKTLKKIIISLLIVAVLAVVGYFVYDQYFKPNNDVSADVIINRTDEDIETINLKIDNIEATIQLIQSNQSLSEKEIATIKSNMQDQIETLRIYQTLIKALQNEVKELKEMQESATESMQSDLQGFVTRLDHIETVVDSITATEPLTTTTHTLTAEECFSVIETGAITCKRYGNVVTVYITHIQLNVEVEAYSAVTIASIPEEYRPSIHVSDAYVSMLTGSHFVEVSEEGNIILSSWANKITTEDWHTICLTYVV